MLVFVAIDDVILGCIGVVFPGATDGRFVGREDITKCYAVRLYFEVGEGDITFHSVIVAVIAFGGMIASVVDAAAVVGDRIAQARGSKE